MAMHIGHIAIRVAIPERSAAHVQQALGLRASEDHARPHVAFS